MQSIYDYKKFAILYVDDEEKSLKYFTRAFSDQFRIFTAPNAEEGFKVFEQHKDEIAVLMTDQRMPGEKGVQLLERVRQLRPRAIRILATAYSDIEAAIAAVNTGAIYKYIHKPWDVPQLEITLKRALEFFMVQVERDQLLHQKLSVLQNIIITDRVIGLGVLASGLGRYFRNSLPAVQAYLDSVPGRLRDDSVSLEALRNPNYWQDLYREVQRQVVRIEAVLSELIPSQLAAPAQEVDLNAGIAKAVETAQSDFKARGICIQARSATELPKLSLNQPSLLKGLEFLLKAEASILASGSNLTLETQATQEGVEVVLRDDGRGLPADQIRALFNPFLLSRDRTQEYGIYLLATYFLIYHQGGTISLSGGSGTTFKIQLPLKAQETSHAQEMAFISQVVANDDLWEQLLSAE